MNKTRWYIGGVMLMGLLVCIAPVVNSQRRYFWVSVEVSVTKDQSLRLWEEADLTKAEILTSSSEEEINQPAEFNHFADIEEFEPNVSDDVSEESTMGGSNLDSQKTSQSVFPF